MFELRQKYKDGNNDVMQILVKLIMNILYGEQIRKVTQESYQCKSDMWIITEFDERVLGYQRINHGNHIVKMRDDQGFLDEVKKVNTMPLHLGAFVLSNSKRIMIIFIHAIGGFDINGVYYTDCDCLYIEKKHWEN